MTLLPSTISMGGSLAINSVSHDSDSIITVVAKSSTERGFSSGAVANASDAP